MEKKDYLSVNRNDDIVRKKKKKEEKFTEDGILLEEEIEAKSCRYRLRRLNPTNHAGSPILRKIH